MAFEEEVYNNRRLLTGIPGRVASRNLIKNFYQTNDPKVVIEMILYSVKRLQDFLKSGVGIPHPQKSNKVVSSSHVGCFGWSSWGHLGCAQLLPTSFPTVITDHPFGLSH